MFVYCMMKLVGNIIFDSFMTFILYSDVFSDSLVEKPLKSISEYTAKGTCICVGDKNENIFEREFLY